LSLVVLCLGGNFAIPLLAKILFPRFTPAGFPAWTLVLAGIVPAQAAILSAGMVWSDKPFFRRLTVHWAAAIVLCWVWLAGMGWSVTYRDLFDIVFGLPLVSLALQLPLWFTRLVWGWRLVRESERGTTAPASFTLRDLFLATLLVAIAIGLARWMPEARSDRDFWPAFAIALAFLSLASALVLLPAGQMLLATSHFARGVAMLAMYTLLAIAAMWLIVLALFLFDPATLAPRNVFVGASAILIGLAATLVFAALAVRLQDYRLCIGRRARL
jgi:hypothetical protein